MAEKDKRRLELPVQGMDCADCTMHVKKALAEVPGVESVEVFLSSEKAILQLGSEGADMPALRRAVERAGYSVPEAAEVGSEQDQYGDFTQAVLKLLGVVFGAVLFVVVVGEWLGVFEAVTQRVPFLIGLGVVLIFGFPVFRNVVKATLRGEIIAHTLMTVGVIAALAVGQWATAAVVVFFMRVGDYAESFTTERARRAVKDLTAMAPQTARVVRDGMEVEVPVEEVEIGETIVVRPGEKIPVDGQVQSGQATINQATITGESMPVEAGPGAKVYAATLVSLGSLRVQATGIGLDTTFGRVIKMVEEAEAHRADVQRVADKFSAYYLPVVAGVAALTFLIRRDPLATAAVLVVACSCSFALATPIAVLASVGAGARRGLMIKGGKYLEILARADVLLIDKTGTLTLGKPGITDVLTAGSDDGEVLVKGWDSRGDVLRLAASAERYSEHPLAEAVRSAARAKGLELGRPDDFRTLPGQGVRACVDGVQVAVGSRKMVADERALVEMDGLASQVEDLERQGKTLLYVAADGVLVGVLAAADMLREEVPQAIEEVRSLGIETVELLTGDNRRTAAALAERIGVRYRAELMPEKKISIVKEYQAQGHTVVMVGDGVNDAPALAQADVGIAMGAFGSDVAIEAAHIALMRDDWSLVPQVLRIAQRTLRVVKGNIAFTAVYNMVGLTLASLGFLPPIFAAAAQSLPDLGILANSSRLLRQK